MNASEAARQAAYDAQTATRAAGVAIEAAKPSPPPDPFRDPTSPVYRALATQEQSALARVSPLRNRWPDVLAFDQRVSELEQRRQLISAELQSLHEQLTDAANADRRALADWTVAGGERPAPTVPRLEQRISELQAELEASAVAIDDVLAEKTAYVGKHRERLVKDADKATAKEHADCLAAIEQLEAARRRLYDARQSALWAALFPDPTTASAIPTPVALGLAKPVGEALHGYTAQIRPEQIWKLLRADADLLSAAVSSEQRKVLGHKDPKAALWAGSPEAIEQEQREKQERIEAYRREWGQDPPRYV